MSLRRRRALACRQIVERVTDYLEGDLSPVDRAAVEAHLSECSHCAGYVESVRKMLALTAQQPERSAVPPEMLATLTARYRSRS